MTDLTAELIELAQEFGIATEFWDWKGNHTRIPAETIVAVLAALDVDASTPQSCAEVMQGRRDAYWRRVVPVCTVIREGNGARIAVHVPAGTTVSATVLHESGRRTPLSQVNNEVPDTLVDGRMRGEATFFAPQDLPLGYHRILVTGDEGDFTGSLIVTPQFVGLPRSMRDERAWGYGTQLYSVSSSKSWGMGDLADLSDLVTWSGTKQFADYVLINPLHAAEPVAPMEPSPYLPASRRFINPIYIRPETIPEFAELKSVQRKAVAKLRKNMVRRNDPSRIDRDASWRAKIEALWMVFQVPRRPAREIAFDDFRFREGGGLHSFATWCSLSEIYGSDWREWPSGVQDPGSDAVRNHMAEHAERIEFYEWLQWVAQTQLSAAQTVAHEVGMSIGILTDLAVGVSGSGAETWMMPDLFAEGMHVGAPPDQYNQTGQDWGQPPWRPDRLEELGYAPFRAMVQASLRRVGGVRIDHIIGLFRLWWVPEGLGPKFGTYVRSNHEALVGILALEAYRSQAVVIGEDLGTVEPWVRDYLAGRGILGTSVLWFEHGDGGGPLPADRWRERCMASVTVHDLPPTLGYLAGDHVRLRESLGLLTEPLEDELDSARREQASWRRELISRGVLAEADCEDPEEVMLALHRYLRLTPSKVLLAALVDAVGERRVQNQPGTHKEYPNWQIPLGDSRGVPIPLEKIFGAELPKRLAAVMNGLERQPSSRWAWVPSELRRRLARPEPEPGPRTEAAKEPAPEPEPGTGQPSEPVQESAPEPATQFEQELVPEPAAAPLPVPATDGVERVVSDSLAPGFLGFVPVRELRRDSDSVPAARGIYVLVRGLSLPPTFLEEGTARKSDDKDPNVAVEVLEERWVDDAAVVYVGSSNQMQRRVKELLRFGEGRSTSHWGGRLIWQLADAEDLQVAWLPVSENPQAAAKSFLAQFQSQYGRLPFANLRA